MTSSHQRPPYPSGSPLIESGFSGSQTEVKMARCVRSLQLMALLAPRISLRSQMQPASYESQITPLHSLERHPSLQLRRRSSRILWCTSLEAILELSRNFLHVAHTAGAGCLPPLGLLTPVVCIGISIGRVLPSTDIVARPNNWYWVVDVHFRILAAGYPHDEQVCF